MLARFHTVQCRADARQRRSHDASAANLRLAARLEEHTMHIARLQHALTMQSAEKQAVAASSQQTFAK